MASDYDPTEPTEVPSSGTEPKPQPHPYLHEPLLYISGIPIHVLDEQIAAAFSQCAPFRPRIPRDGNSPTLSGTIEFRFLDAGVYSYHTFHVFFFFALHWTLNFGMSGDYGRLCVTPMWNCVAGPS